MVNCPHLALLEKGKKVDSSLYGSEEERLSHLNAIHRLESEAATNGLEDKAVEMLYEAELTKLKKTARIKNYLSVFIARRVKDKLKRNYP